MIQFLSMYFFLGFLQFLLGFSKVPIFLCHPVIMHHTFSLSKGYESNTKLQPTGATETGWEDTLHQPKGQQIRESQEGYIQETDQPG